VIDTLAARIIYGIKTTLKAATAAIDDWRATPDLLAIRDPCIMLA
jgi:hypothetical protein